MIRITLTVERQWGYQEWANRNIKTEFKDDAFEILLGKPIVAGIVTSGKDNPNNTPHDPRLVKIFTEMADALIWDIRQADSPIRKPKETETDEKKTEEKS